MPTAGFPPRIYTLRASPADSKAHTARLAKRAVPLAETYRREAWPRSLFSLLTAASRPFEYFVFYALPYHPHRQ